MGIEMDPRKLLAMYETLDTLWKALPHSRAASGWEANREEFLALLEDLSDHAGDATMWRMIDKWREAKP